MKIIMERDGVQTNHPTWAAAYRSLMEQIREDDGQHIGVDGIKLGTTAGTGPLQGMTKHTYATSKAIYTLWDDSPIQRSSYEVIIGNIGQVYSGFIYSEAKDAYRAAIGASRGGVGRAGGEQVTLWGNGEPLIIFEGERHEEN